MPGGDPQPTERSRLVRTGIERAYQWVLAGWPGHRVMELDDDGQFTVEWSQKPPMQGRTLAMIFDKPSTRTRVSFDVGVRQMGGQTMVLSGSDMQLGHGETISDTARVLSTVGLETSPFVETKR